MKPLLKTVVAILESSTAKTDYVASGRRDEDLHRQFRGEWVNGKFYAVVLQKCGQKFDACAELLLLLLLLVIKKALYLNTKVLTEDTNCTSPTRDGTSIFCGYQSHAMAVPSLLSYCGALRVLVQSQGLNPRPPALKSKFFLAVAVVVAWGPNWSDHFELYL